MSVVYDNGTFHGISPAYSDKSGPLFKEEDVNNLTAKSIICGTWEKMKAKNMTAEISKAAEILDENHKVFAKKLEQFSKLEQDFSATAKKSSGSVRDAAQKLADGLARLEKTANFDRLERMTVLLERAEKALSALAELEKAGKLDKSSALLK